LKKHIEVCRKRFLDLSKINFSTNALGKEGVTFR
jgi:hypothetical protein